MKAADRVAHIRECFARELSAKGLPAFYIARQLKCSIAEAQQVVADYADHKRAVRALNEKFGGVRP